MKREKFIALATHHNKTPTRLIKFHKHLLAAGGHVVSSLSCNDVVVAEVVEIEVLVKDFEDLGWLVGAVGARHVDA